jgi:hypothetical protein
VPRSRPPRDPPEFFVDRSLGYHLLPDALRALGFAVHTMRSVYGPDAEETVPDVVWLEQAGRAGWVVLPRMTRSAAAPWNCRRSLRTAFARSASPTRT